MVVSTELEQTSRPLRVGELTVVELEVELVLLAAVDDELVVVAVADPGLDPRRSRMELLAPSAAMRYFART